MFPEKISVLNPIQHAAQYTNVRFQSCENETIKAINMLNVMNIPPSTDHASVCRTISA